MQTLQKRLKRAWLWTRIRQVRAKRWWLRNDRRYGWLWRAGNGTAALLVLMAAAMPVLQQLQQTHAYALDADTLKLVGSTDPALLKQLTYNPQTRMYQFNKDAIQDPSDANPLAAMQAQVGTADGGGGNKSLYALDVPQIFSKGVTYHDINSQLSFSLVPEFDAAQGQVVQGHVVFPLGSGRQAIYTLKNNGLKEDIVVQKPGDGAMTFTYRLDLPKSLAVKPIPNGDGAIGIYSADPALFSNVSYASDADRAAVQKARENGDKTYLVFGLPSPVIKTPDGQNVGSARFELHGNELSVVATGLSDVTTPVTIDPSVIVTSAADFQTGNVEDNISFANGQATVGALTGGTISAGWSSPGNSYSTVRYGSAAIAYNGYLYVIGGCGTQTSLTTCNNNYLSDIQYIAINSSTGALTGSWASAGASLAAGRFGLSAVAYNGYLYVIGGYDGSTYNNDVQSIAINSSTGALTGSWNASAGSFTGGRYLGAAAVYNNYLYVLGGYNGSTYYGTTQYASLNADGTVASFTTATNSFITGRFGLSVVAYSGYLYVLGGCTAGTCSTYKNDVQYAGLGADGSPSAWHYTHNSTDDSTTFSAGFTTARFGQSAVAYNGYMYLMGGYSGSYQTDSQYAPINDGGTIGTWATANTSNNISAVAEAPAAAYNGYLYVVGGSVSGTPQTTSKYATIDLAGQPNWSTDSTHTISAARAGVCSVAYNGYLYAIGGSTNNPNTNTTTNSNNVTTVNYTTINAAGVLAAWNTTQVLPKNRSYAGCAANNGFMYVIGGYSASGTGNGTQDGVVMYSPINATNGTLGSWVTAKSMTAISGGTNFMPVGGGVFAYGGYLYSVGGYHSAGTSNTANNGVYYTLICTGNNNGVGGCNSTAGSLGNWASTSTGLTAGYTFRSYARVGKYLYAFGGQDRSDSSIKATVEYAPIDTSNGTVGTWNTTTSMPGAIQFARGVTLNGCIYSVGGEDAGGTSQTAVYYACPASNGTIAASGPNAWNTAPGLGTATANVGGASYNGYLFAVGGWTTAATGNIGIAAVNNGGSGQIGSWKTAATTLPGGTGRELFSAVAYNGYLYFAAGNASGNTPQQDIRYAALNADGTVGGMNSGPNIPSTRKDAMVTAYGGYLYVIGGVNGNYTIYPKDVNYAAIGSNGSLGSLSTVSFMSGGNGTGRAGGCAVGYNGYLYLIGGYDNDNGNLNTVTYAPIGSSGTPGTWQPTSAFTNGRGYQRCFAYNGYMYMVGGNSSVSYNDVQVAPINSDGTLGTWMATTSFHGVRSNFVLGVADGFVYIVGGCTDTNGDCTGSSTSTVEFAPINPGGTLGDWQHAPSISANRGAGAGFAYNGNLYMLGGYTGSGFMSDIQYIPLNVIARTGHYSKLVDVGGVANITGVSYNGTLSQLVTSISYRSAGVGASFGSLALASGISGVGGCIGNLTNTRYIWVSLTLDDSAGLGTGGIFPDAAGTNGYVADFTVNYTIVHPPPDQRLRGGKVLVNGSQSVLDTCG